MTLDQAKLIAEDASLALNQSDRLIDCVLAAIQGTDAAVIACDSLAGIQRILTGVALRLDKINE